MWNAVPMGEWRPGRETAADLAAQRPVEVTGMEINRHTKQKNKRKFNNRIKHKKKKKKQKKKSVAFILYKNRMFLFSVVVFVLLTNSRRREEEGAIRLLLGPVPEEEEEEEPPPTTGENKGAKGFVSSLFQAKSRWGDDRLP